MFILSFTVRRNILTAILSFFLVLCANHYSSQYQVIQFDNYHFYSSSWTNHSTDDPTIENWENGNIKTQLTLISDSLFLKEEYFEDGGKKLLSNVIRTTKTDTIVVTDDEGEQTLTLISVFKEYKNGLYKEYYDNDKNDLKCEGIYLIDQKTGIWTRFLLDGSCFEAEYVDGKLNGPFAEFYSFGGGSKGAIKTKGQYGLKESKRVNRNPETGQRETTTVLSSLPIGNWLYFHPDGTVDKMLSFDH